MGLILSGTPKVVDVGRRDYLDVFILLFTKLLVFSSQYLFSGWTREAEMEIVCFNQPGNIRRGILPREVVSSG